MIAQALKITSATAMSLYVRLDGEWAHVEALDPDVTGGVRSVVLITQCDLFDIPSTSHWTDAAITV